MGAKVKYQYPFEPTSLSLSKETLSFASADNGTQTVDINTDATNWTYACTDSWINVNKNEKTLPISVTATEYVSERTGKITVIANEKRKEIAVIQAPILFSLSKETLSFGSIDNGTQTVDINTDATNWTYSCDSWINVNKNGKTLSISVTANEYVLAERIGKITVQVYENQKEITVIQSPITKTSAPYSIGTVYCENGVTGIVYKITDNGYHGMIMSLDEISCQWSANDRYDGINFDNDNDNGMNNMNIIKQLPNWDIRFPAFKWCDDFNKGTVTGWYLPAINELSQVYAGYNDLDTYPGVEDGAYNIYNAERNKFNSVLVGNGGVALSQDRWWWDWYWSSSGDGAAGAYTLSFRNGNQSVYSYTDNHRVRAVRAF
jgi:hypothetical protein